MLFGFLLIFLAYKMAPQGQSADDGIVEFAITAVAFVDVALGFFLPRSLMRQAARAPRGKLQTTPVQRWMTFSVMSLAFFQSCNLLAFFLHTFGASSNIVVVLFAAGMGSLIFWSPGRPPAGAEGSITQL